MNIDDIDGVPEVFVVLNDDKMPVSVDIEASRDAKSVRYVPASLVQYLREDRAALDKNWSALHAASMDAIRDALGMPGATVPEMVERIGKLRAVAGVDP
jgi:hypothetical protein